MDANYQQHVRSFKLSEQDYLIITTNGGRIVKLVLGGVTVIEGLQQYTQLGCGSYLMYPWVNRLQKPQHPYQPVFYDGNGLPIHGLVVNALSNIKAEQRQKSLVITIKPAQLSPQLPDFTQTYTLQHNKLIVHFKIDGKSSLPVCFGYHPYLQINHQDINHLTIETNLKKNIKLDEKTLLPVYPFVENDMHLSSHNKYDHLFQHTEHGNIYFRISKHGGHSVEIRSQDMKYWQIYTPPDGKRIAVEPMTFMGNLYTLYSQQKFGKLPSEGTFTITLK